MVVKKKSKPQLTVPKHLMPACDTCKTSKHVREIGPDTFGHEFYCSKCKHYWAQSV